MESTLKTDIRTILDILHQQQQTQIQMQQQQSQQLNLSGKQIGATPYQPSDSEFSFDLCGISNNEKQRMNVQRSISQPECTNNEKSLLRYRLQNE